MPKHQPLSVPPAYRSFAALRDSPWRLHNELRRRITIPLARLHFARHGIAWGQQWRIFGLPIIQRHRQSTICLGDYLELRSWYVSNPLAPNHPVLFATRSAGASITVGQGCGFTGTVIVAAENITIGDRVIVGANAVITDSDFHPIDPDLRRVDALNAAHAPVLIGDDVFIGMCAIILKGVTIGCGSTVGAGSIVVQDVPPRTVVAGNPARVIRELK
jgi:acetyltransferase-like isoleucine patch superfamily enzyme